MIIANLAFSRTVPAREIKLMLLAARIAPVLIFAILIGCAAGPVVLTDMDTTVDFSQFRTYEMMNSEARNADGVYGSLVERRIIAAIERELRQRGYAASENPDLLVNFDVFIEERVEVATAPVHVARPHRHTFYSPWSAHTTWETQVWRSEEGTLIIDLVDAKRRQLVWTGSAQKTISDRIRERPEEATNNAVGAIFAKFPFAAGKGSAE